MNADTPAVAPDLRSLVAAEVERQVKALREEVEAKIAEVRERTVDDAATIVVFSSDLDKVLAAFIIATRAQAGRDTMAEALTLRQAAPVRWAKVVDHTRADARELAVGTGELVRVETRIGHFVVKAWVTEGIRPGVVACSHHMGRWKLEGPDAYRLPGPPLGV